MKNIRKEKGITLIALVITIIVLLILAGVAISMLSGENGILTKASEAKEKTEEAQRSEEKRLVDLELLIDESTGNLEKIKKYKGVKIEKKKKKLVDNNGETIVIPVGFKIKEDSPTTVKSGIVVVAPDESEFVWVPVKDITKMAKEIGGIDSKGRINYQGKLYEFESEDGVYSAKEMENYGQGTTSYREPSLVTGNANDTYAVLESVTGTSYDADSNYYNIILGYDSAIEFGKAMQEEYNEMIESVKINKGFYVGRYETSLELGKAQSKTGKESATAAEESANMWYGLYKVQKEYSISNNIINDVGSSMIWGSQYDQMMIWMQSNGIDVKSSTIINLEGNTAKKNLTQITGSELLDKLNNIYDLIGNKREWTLERTNRGDNSVGVSEHYISPATRVSVRGNYPNYTFDSVGSRLALYIK